MRFVMNDLMEVKKKEFFEFNIEYTMKAKAFGKGYDENQAIRNMKNYLNECMDVTINPCLVPDSLNVLVVNKKKDGEDGQ